METNLSYLEKLGLRGNQFYYKIERVRETNGVYISTIHLIFQNNTSTQIIQILNIIALSITVSNWIITFHMNDEHFEEINEIAFPTPEHAASVLGVDEQFP